MKQTAVDCEFLVDNRRCKAIESAEGKSTRENSCANKSKNSCCYLCNNQDLCAISCNYLAKPKDMSEFNESIEQKIKGCRAKIENLSLLFADGKIEEQSYADSVKTIERKIDDLNKSKSNPLTSPHIYSPDEFAEHAQRPTASARSGQTDDSISSLASQTKNLGYYAGLTFGVGYCLILIGVIAVIAEIIVRYSSAMSGYWGYVGAQIPSWLIASMIFFAIGIICAIYFGFTIIKNSKSARDYGLKIDTIASSVSAFSFMLIFTWIGITIIAAASKLSLFSPICGVVGPILLLIGFRAYNGKASESKLIGAILMLVSIALIYFVAYRGGLHSFLGLGAGLLGFQWPGPLLSELTLEILALLIATVCAVIFAFPILGEELKKSIAGIILSISGILFSVGVMYFNFSTVSAIDRLLSLVGMTQWIPGVPRITLDTIWIMFFGFLLLGISGILGLVTACLPLAISAKQLSTRLETPQLKTPEGAPPRPSDVKYCTKCGASMPLDAIYCLKCGQKQPKEEKV